MRIIAHIRKQLFRRLVRTGQERHNVGWAWQRTIFAVVLIQKMQDDTVEKSCRRVWPELISLGFAIGAHHDGDNGLNVRKFFRCPIVDFGKRVPACCGAIRAERLEFEHLLFQDVLAVAACQVPQFSFRIKKEDAVFPDQASRDNRADTFSAARWCHEKHVLNAVMQHKFMRIRVDADHDTGILDDLLFFCVRDQSKELLLRLPILIDTAVLRCIRPKIGLVNVLFRREGCTSVRCLHQQIFLDEIH